MKTMKYLLLTLILFFTGTVLFAKGDGTVLKETTPVVIILDVRSLIPEIPPVATFEEPEAENRILVQMETARKFAPVVPVEADFDETVPEGNSLSPVVPLEATFNDTL